MAKRVNIPGVGVVDFPDGMSDEEINSAAGRLYRGAQNPQTPQTPAPPPAPDRSAELPDLNGSPATPRKGNPVNAAEDAWRRLTTPVALGWEGLKGVADLALSGAVSGFGMATGGWAGITTGFLTDDPKQAADVTKYWTNTISRAPASSAGREIASGLAGPIEKYDETIKDVSNVLAFGNPEAATLIYTGLNAPVQIYGGRTGLTRIPQSIKTWQIKMNYLRRGIRIGSPEMEQQLIDTVRRESGDVPRERGAALERDVIPSVRSQHGADVAGIESAENLVKNSKARIDIEGVGDTRRRLQMMLDRTFPTGVVKSQTVQDALAELDKLIGFEDEARTTFSQVQTAAMGQPGTMLVQNREAAWRPYSELYEASQRLDRRLPNDAAQKLSPEQAALTMVKSAYDDMIDSRIRQGFIQGDDSLAGNRVLLARLRKEYQERWQPGTEVYRMATELQASPEDFRKYIMGLSSNGMKTEAAQTIDHLIKLFGEESPEVNGMRLEFLSDALEPLRGPTPDVKKFLQHYETVLRNNRTTISRLDPYGSRMLDDIYRAARASQRVGSASKFTLNPLKFIPRWIVGHQISRRGAMVNASQQLAEALFGRTEATVRRQMLNEIAGIDTKAPMFANRTTRLQAAYSAAVANEFGEEEE